MIIEAIVGIVGSLLPSVFNFFNRRQEINHDLEVLKIKSDAQDKQLQSQFDLEAFRSSVAEGQSLRLHDSTLDGGVFLNTLRASVRPVITYVFFIVFIAIKIIVAGLMVYSGQNTLEIIKTVWDTETMSLFVTIVSFWFGSRMVEKNRERNLITP